MIQDVNSILRDLHESRVDVVLSVKQTFGAQDVSSKVPVYVEIHKLTEYRDYL